MHCIFLINSRLSETPSYTDMKRRREEFRKQLVALIVSNSDERDDSNEFPSADECEILRYYYYVKHGIDTIHVSPMADSWLRRIRRQLPPISQQMQPIIAENFAEINEEYTLAVKKAVVDFVLGESLHRQPTSTSKENLSAERIYLSSIALKYKHKFLENRQKISRTLFSINPCVAQILKAWHMYDDVNLINIDKLIERKESFELSEFVVSCSPEQAQCVRLRNHYHHLVLQTTVTKQVEDTKVMLLDKWYNRIKELLLKGTKKKHVPEVSKVKILNRFYDSVAALMSQNLSEITIRTLHKYTDFMCDIGVSIIARCSITHEC